MRRWMPQISVMLASLAVTIGTERVAAQPDRLITVNVSIQTDTNQPLPDVPLFVVGTDDIVRGHTDAAGDSSIEVRIDPSEDWVYVGMIDMSDRGPAYLDIDDAKYNQMRTEYSVDGSYYIEIEPDVDVYQLQITAYPAITVSGRVVDSQGQPIDTALWRRGGMEGVVIEDDTGMFSLGGFRAGHAAELLIFDDNLEWHSVMLSANQTLQDVDLGDVMINIVARDVPVSGTVTGLQDTRDNSVIGPSWSPVDFVSDNSDHVFVATVRAGSVICSDITEPGQPALVPVGRYYVAPGGLIFGASRTPWMLIDLIRAGRQADLDTAGAVTIDAVAGQPLNVQIDAVAAETAILTVGGG